MTQAQRNQAFYKYKIIQPYLQQQDTLVAVCKKSNISLRTAKSWVSIYHKYGLAALSRKTRVDKGKTRYISSELVELIEGIYLQSPHLSYAVIFRQIKNYQEEKGLKYPKYRTVCNILSKIPKSILTLAHQGTKSYSEKFDLLYRREAQRPNEIWQADHAKLDMMLLNQMGKAQRPWLTIIFDDYSRGVAGYELSFTAPSAMKTALCLRMAIWRKKDPLWTICGIPEILYTDHGSDFTSLHTEQVCIDLKINLIFSTIGKPRGRGKIERFFLTLNQLILCELPGYTKNKDINAKLTLKDFDILLKNFITEYNQREHSQTGSSPKQRWEKNGFLPNMPETIEKLDLLLLTICKPRKIMRDGIHFQGLRYLDPILADYVGESVTIRYDPSDITSIRVFYKENFLCQPVCQILSDQSIGLKEIQAARLTRKRLLHKRIKNRLSLVDALLNKTRNHKGEYITTIELPLKTNKLKMYEADT